MTNSDPIDPQPSSDGPALDPPLEPRGTPAPDPPRTPPSGQGLSAQERPSPIGLHPASPSPGDRGRKLTPGGKVAVELGPLLVFFGGYFLAKRAVGAEEGIIWATGAFVVATMLALAVSFKVERKIPPVTLVTAVIVTAMGILTIYLGDSKFIQLKPTIVSGLMGSVLLGGLAFGKSLVQPVLGATLPMDDEGWRTLTFRWALFFLGIAALNEVVRRQMSFDQWITYKTFGILPLTFIFLLCQAPLMERHRIEAPPTTGE